MPGQAASASSATLLNQVAREYERKGYVVIVAPRDQQLPGFLSGTAPDLLAMHADESVVIQAASRHSPGLADLPQLADRIEGHPGWRLELLYLGSDREDAGSAYLSPSDMEASATAAGELASRGDLRDAMLLLGAAVEGALLLVARRAGVPRTGMTGVGLLDQLAIDGLVDRDEYALLKDALQFRDTLSRGYSSDALTTEFVSRIRSIMSELLASELPAAG